MSKTEKFKHPPPKNYACFSYSRHCIFEKDTVPLDLSGAIPTEICELVWELFSPPENEHTTRKIF